MCGLVTPCVEEVLPDVPRDRVRPEVHHDDLEPRRAARSGVLLNPLQQSVADPMALRRRGYGKRPELAHRFCVLIFVRNRPHALYSPSGLGSSKVAAADRSRTLGGQPPAATPPLTSKLTTRHSHCELSIGVGTVPWPEPRRLLLLILAANASTSKHEHNPKSGGVAGV